MNKRRCRSYKYTSPIAGKVRLDGKWELAVAKWLDKKKYTWERNKKRFKYVDLKGKTRYYVPDFYVEELGGYLEVKGLETKLDYCKWAHFPEPLKIWRRLDLKEKGIIK